MIIHSVHGRFPDVQEELRGSLDVERKVFQKTQEEIEGEEKTETKSAALERAFGNSNFLKPLKVFFNYPKIIR